MDFKAGDIVFTNTIITYSNEDPVVIAKGTKLRVIASHKNKYCKSGVGVWLKIVNNQKLVTQFHSENIELDSGLLTKELDN